MFKYGKSSLDRINDPKLHPLLKKILIEAIKTTPIDYMVVETSRTMELQKRYKKTGKTTTLKSRHIPENNKSRLCEAFDLAPIVNGKLDYSKCDILAKHILSVAKKLNIKLTWGGSWDSFVDKPHFQLG